MKKTKIICTLGPACYDKKIIAAMADAGMNVARLNFSHGSHETHAQCIKTIKEVREEKQIPLPILLDTKGPEFRIGTFENNSITLSEGDIFTFTTEDVQGDQTKVSVSYKDICEELCPNDKILLNNGLVVFRVEEVNPPNVRCITEIGGTISNRKSMFFPDKELKMTFLSEQDKADLLFGIQQDVDFVALSFVSKAQDVLDARNFLDAHGGENIDIIAKIEKLREERGWTEYELAQQSMVTQSTISSMKTRNSPPKFRFAISTVLFYYTVKQTDSRGRLSLQ